jgi:hypothetical protein
MAKTSEAAVLLPVNLAIVGIDIDVNDSKIASQIRDAKTKLLTSIDYTKVSDHHCGLIDHVLDSLEFGMVLPIFHALVMGKPCVAFRTLTDSETKQAYDLNLAEGEVEESTPCGMKQSLAQIGEAQPDHDNSECSMSHCDDITLPRIDQVEAGHDPSWTEDHITEAKEPLFMLGDKAHLIEEAITDKAPHLHLGDSEWGTINIFDYDIEATNVAVHLVNQPATMCGYGVEATHMIGLLDIKREEAHVKSWNLLTHPQSRGSIATCFDTRDASLMIGSPGIGKSWSLLYALQQALLYNNALVLLYACKNSKTYLFRRQGNKIYAWKATNNRKAVSSIMGRHDCLVLYDPAEADKGGADFDEGSCQTSNVSQQKTCHK